LHRQQWIKNLQGIMLYRSRNLILIAAIAASLAACTGGSPTTSQSEGTTPTSGEVSPASDTKPVAPAADAPASVAIPGVKSASEVKFSPPAPNNPHGFFDTVNGASTTKHTTAKTAPIKLTGWAALPDKNKAADSVIITLADNQTVVAVVPVKLPRVDVAKALNKPGYQASGWIATINAASLPAGKSSLKAWAYDSATKQAYQLNPTHEITVE
jgi:hypothetical protein